MCIVQQYAKLVRMYCEIASHKILSKQNPLRLHPGTARVTPAQRKEMLGSVLSLMLQGKRVGLVCSCAPKPCHGDVIAAKLVRMYCEIASP